MSRSSVLSWLVTALLALSFSSSPGSLQAQISKGRELTMLTGQNVLHELTLNTQVATTITFPDQISLVTGYGLVLNSAAVKELMDAELLAAATLKELAPPAVTVVHYARASQNTLVMRAVRSGTPCFLTVRCGEKVYLFKLTAGDEVNLAVIVSDKGRGSGAAVEVSKEQVLQSRTAYSSTELISILSKARQRAFLQNAHPAMYEGWKQRLGLDLTSKNKDLVATIKEVHQYPEKDALVFRCELATKGGRTVNFNPSDVKIRIGNAAYPVQLADSSGVVKPGKVTALDVVLQGNASGGKEHISINNDFRLEVAEASSPPPPNDLLPPPNPLLPHLENGSQLMPLPESQASATSSDGLYLPLPGSIPSK